LENQLLTKEAKSLEKKLKVHIDMKHIQVIEENEYDDSSDGSENKNYDTELQA
jgi:hypothetical protein